MSMNLTLGSGKKGDAAYSLFQTPTDVTFDILSQKDKYQAYIRWIRASGIFNMKNPEAVKEFEELKNNLKAWLKANPNHKWSYI